MKKMKKFLLTALAVLVTFSSCGGALADAELPYTTYNYDYWGYIVYTPAAYVPAGSITGTSFQYNGQSLGAFKNPQDLCVAQDGTVYLADSGNNRIVHGRGSRQRRYALQCRQPQPPRGCAESG